MGLKLQKPDESVFAEIRIFCTFGLLNISYIRLDISLPVLKKLNFYIDQHCCLIVDRRAGQLRLQLLLRQLDLNIYIEILGQFLLNFRGFLGPRDSKQALCLRLVPEFRISKGVPKEEKECWNLIRKRERQLSSDTTASNYAI